MDLPQFKDEFKNFTWPWYIPPVDKYQILIENLGFKDVRGWGENADRYFYNVKREHHLTAD